MGFLMMKFSPVQFSSYGFWKGGTETWYYIE